MKRLFTLLTIFAFTSGAFSQVPEKMSYQAVVRNASGELIKTGNVGIQISILQGTETGTAVFVETHAKTTNENGLVTLEIGNGTPVTGTFAGVDWSAGIYFLKTETDPAGGTNYSIMGTSQILSVPYSLYAKYASTSADAVKFHTASLSVIGNNSPIINTGTRNILLGKSSGMSNSTGAYNTFVGSEAGYRNTIGNNNVAIGQNALRENDEGKNNVAIGLNALRKSKVSAPGSTDPIGSGNIAIGENSLGNATSTFYNVGVGAGSLMSLTGGTDNTAIGGSAMSSLLSGIQNTVVGAASMIYSTEGSYNVTVGVSSGERIAGNGNVFIGANSGNHNKGSGNVFIGYLSGWGTTWENASSRLIIHNGNNNIHDIPLIYGEFDNSKVVINGSFTATDGINTSNKPITNVPTPVNSTDAVNKEYVDALLIRIQQLEDNAIRLKNLYIEDIQGNLYAVIKIGNQVWMKTNLMVTKFNNGDPIPNIKDNIPWSALTTGACSFYNNDSINNAQSYGALYNYFVIKDSRNVCPVGWHVPSADDWAELDATLGGADVAGGKLKYTGLWNSPNTGASNSSGFTAMPSGYRTIDGQFLDFGISCSWWILPVDNSTHGWAHRLYYNSAADEFNQSPPLNVGYSVRCIQNK